MCFVVAKSSVTEFVTKKPTDLNADVRAVNPVPQQNIALDTLFPSQIGPKNMVC